MAQPSRKPTTLVEAVRYFEDLDRCTEYVAALRWPNGPECPRCGSTQHSYVSTRRVWTCKACKRQYSVKIGTIFEDSPLGLDKWLPAVWLAANSKNGISSHELSRALGVTQKSTWFMLHRIRLAMQEGTFMKLSGEVEVDETYIGGLARNMHKADKPRRLKGKTGMVGKTAIVGALQRDGEVRAGVVRSVRRRTLHSHIQDHIEEGSTVYTDAHSAYRTLEGYTHKTIDHAEKYVDGRVHTNGMENFWSLVKRGLHGTYVSVEPFHLFRYLDERVFTFNQRHLDDRGRFDTVLRAVTGRRLTWAELTASKS